MKQRNTVLISRIVFAAIIVVFCFRAASLHPREFFGFFQDDTLYFSTAKALSSGQGYIFPSFPGVLPQTKYPILYPLLLSAVWRLAPDFPANLRIATALSIAIAAAYLALSYVFIRRLGTSATMGLCILAVIAMRPQLLWLAGAVLSDYLFALLVVGCVLAADGAWLNPERDRYWAVTAGLLLGLALLARSAGIGIVAGIALYGAMQRRWRPLAIILLVCSAVKGGGMVVTHMISPRYMAAAHGAPPIGFQHVATFYTSYLQFWLLSTPQLSVLGDMVWRNLQLLLIAPGDSFVMAGVLLPATLFTKTLATLVALLCIGGVARLYRTTSRRTMIFALLGSLPVLLLWNSPIYDRFLLPFLPLIFLGGAIELSRIVGMLNTTIRRGDAGERIAAAAIATVLAGLFGIAAYNYSVVGRRIGIMSQWRASVNRERRQAYDWIAANTPSSARVLTYSDGLTYLYTGRQSIRPVVFTTDCFYQPKRGKCNVDFDEMGTWIGYAGTRYWLTAPTDFELEGGRELRPEVQERIAALKSRSKPVFVSGNGTVIVYDTTCLIDGNDPGCSNNSGSPFQTGLPKANHAIRAPADIRLASDVLAECRK